MFLLLYFMLMRKNVIYTTEKQNMISDFVSVCCCIIYLTTWQLVEKTVEKKVWFSNQVLNI